MKETQDYEIETDDAEDDELEYFCEVCSRLTSQQLITRKTYSKTDILKVRCRYCGTVTERKFTFAKEIPINVIISDGDISIKTQVELPEDEIIFLKDELIADGINVQITGIEISDGKRAESTPASSIKTLWVKKFEKVSFNIKLKRKDKSVFKSITAVVDEEFEIGEIIDIEDKSAAITGIKLDDGKTLKHGSIQARYITQIFAREIDTCRRMD